MQEFVLLIYQGTTPLPGTPEWEALSQEEQAAIYADYGAINQTAGVSPGPPLGLPADARTVRVENGAVDATAGPYHGLEDAVGGFMVFEADDLDAALALAARVPAARHGGAVEVRPAAKYW
jgi:hypothetical protein